MTWINVYYRLEFFFELLAVELLFMPYFKRRKMMPLSILTGSAVCLLILYFTPYLDFGPYVNVVIESLKFAVIFLLFIVLFFFSFEVKWNNAIFITVCAYAIQHIGYSFAEIIRVLLNLNDGIRRFIYQNQWLVALRNLICFAVVYFAMYRFFIRKFQKESDYRVERARQTVLSMIIVATTIVLNLLEVRLTQGLPFLIRLSTRTYAIVCCLFAILIQLGLFEKNQLQQKNKILDQLLHAEAKHHQMSKENIEFINMKCHDLKKQIAQLRTFTDEKAKEEYITEIENAVMFYDNLAKTGNESLDIVLAEKNLLCKKNGIQLSYIANGEKLEFMNSVDVYSLFSNALDNAVASVCKIEDTEKRVISMKISAREKLLKINIENYYEGDIVFENGLPLTENDDKQLHGYGIKSMKNIVQKYNGNFLINTENHIFRVQILMPVP